jgi:hypothetical protein
VGASGKPGAVQKKTLVKKKLAPAPQPPAPASPRRTARRWFTRHRVLFELLLVFAHGYHPSPATAVPLPATPPAVRAPVAPPPIFNLGREAPTILVA